MQRVTGREIDRPAEKMHEPLPQLHVSQEAEAGIIDVGE